MTVVDNLLISSPTLQEFLVDKFGNPLVNGVVTLTEDTSRLVLKNWYYQTGSPGSYTFVALNNPMTLSSAGSILDPSGNDTIPFFYPYDETSGSANPPVQKYYISVTDSQGNLQFNRQDFPYDLSTNAGGGGTTQVPTFENIVVNNEFWRNVGTVTGTPNALNGTVLAPSQHDGFRMSDIQYVASGASGTDTIAFTQFAAGSQTLTGDVTPEWYIDFTSTASAASRIIQIPLSLHLLTLGGLTNCTVTIQGQSASLNNSIELAILADYGTNGATPSASILGTIVLPSTWGKSTITFTMPNSSALVSPVGDDAFYLQIILPAGVTNLQIAKPSVYLSADVPTNNFSSYDVIDAVINSPRTGDIRTSLNAFSPYGWVPANDGSIALTSGGTTRNNADVWQLYELLWNGVNNTFAPVAGGRGVSAYADFTGNKAMTLPLMLGRSLLGLPPASTTTYAKTAPAWSASTGNFTVSSTLLFYVGAPIYLTGTMPAGGPFVANTIYYAVIDPNQVDVTHIQLASTYANALAGIIINDVASTTIGSNIIINFSLAGTIGESAHNQLLNELVAHVHPPGIGGNFITSGGAGAAFDPTTAGTPWNATSTATGPNAYANYGNIVNSTNQQKFNIVQPSTYLNVFLKL